MSSVETPFNLHQNIDFSGAGDSRTKKKVLQPKYKWSFDGQNLTIWPVDPDHGQPHHIEVTGMDFWKLAQGRVYEDPAGTFETLVWADRGTEEMQDAAVTAVDDWLEDAEGKIADFVSFQSEGGYYPTIDPTTGPDMDKLMTTYFGYPVKWKGNTVEVIETDTSLNSEWQEAAQRDAASSTSSAAKLAWRPFKKDKPEVQRATEPTIRNVPGVPQQYKTPEQHVPQGYGLPYIDDIIQEDMRWSYHPEYGGLSVWPARDGYHVDWQKDQGFLGGPEEYAGGIIYPDGRYVEYHSTDVHPELTTEGNAAVAEWLRDCGVQPQLSPDPYL